MLTNVLPGTLCTNGYSLLGPARKCTTPLV
jgi:hypothetical protein